MGDVCGKFGTIHETMGILIKTNPKSFHTLVTWYVLKKNVLSIYIFTDFAQTCMMKTT